MRRRAGVDSRDGVAADQVLTAAARHGAAVACRVLAHVQSYMQCNVSYASLFIHAAGCHARVSASSLKHAAACHDASSFIHACCSSGCGSHAMPSVL